MVNFGDTLQSNGSVRARGRGRPPGRSIDGEVLRAVREARGLTRAQLAERACIHVHTVARAERGVAVSHNSILAIAQALQVPSERLTATDDDPGQLEQGGLSVPPLPDLVPAYPDHEGWLIDQFTAARPNMLCIAGPSGAGKTALALRVAHGARAALTAGALWLDASNLGRASDVVAAQCRIAKALHFVDRLPVRDDVHGSAFDRAFLSQLWSSPGRLLVIDNLVSPSVAAHFVPRCGQVPVLITTRSRQVARRFEHHAMTLHGVELAGARRILMRSIGPERVVYDRAGVARLHRLLGASPRSLTVAGAVLQRQPLLEIGEYADGLRRDPWFAELPPAQRNAQNSIHASFATVARTLSPASRSLLGYLSSFDVWPFSLDDAAAWPEMNSHVELKRLLGDLLDLYLVEVQPSDQPGGPRAGSRRYFRLAPYALLLARGIRHDERSEYSAGYPRR